MRAKALGEREAFFLRRVHLLVFMMGVVLKDHYGTDVQRSWQFWNLPGHSVEPRNGGGIYLNTVLISGCSLCSCVAHSTAHNVAMQRLGLEQQTLGRRAKCKRYFHDLSRQLARNSCKVDGVA